MKLQSHGIETTLLPGWEGRIMVRNAQTVPAERSTDGSGEVTVVPAERPNPVVHLANFALPEQRGDFGSVRGTRRVGDQLRCKVASGCDIHHTGTLFEHIGVDQRLRRVHQERFD